MVRNNVPGRPISRRNVIKTAGVATLSSTLIAGCTGGTDEETSGPERPINLEEWPPSDSSDTLNIWNWYFDWRDEIAPKFRDEYEVDTTNLNGYANPSEWYTQLQSGQHDIDNVGSTVLFTQRAMENDLAEPIPTDLMPNWSNIKDTYIEDIQNYSSQDGNVYAIPFAAPLVPTLTYNEEFFESPPDSWSVFWNEDLEGRLVMWDRPFITCQIAAMHLGIDPNGPFSESDFEDIEEALNQQRDLNITYFTDKGPVRELLADGECVAVPFSANDTATVRFDRDKPINYTVPEEGSMYSLDQIMMPSEAPHKMTSVLFLDYALSDTSVSTLFNSMNGISTVENVPEKIEGDVPQEQIDFQVWSNNDDWDVFLREPLPDETLQRFDEIVNRVKAGA